MITNLPIAATPKLRTREGSIPLSQFVMLRLKGLTETQIATLLKCSVPNVHQRLQQADLQLNLTKVYQDNRSMMLAYWQAQILNSIRPTDLKKAGLQAKITSLAILFDKQRLQDDKSTSNIDYHAVIEAKQRKQGELTLLRNLKQLPGVNK